MMENYIHDFHFVMDRGMKERLMGLEMYKECGGLSSGFWGLLMGVMGMFWGN